MQITFDDEKTLADFKMAVQKGYEKPLMPSISNRTTAIPGMIGEWDHGSELGVIKEKYSIACFEQDPIEREKWFNEFIAYCSDMYRKPRLMKMRFSTEPDKFIYGKIYKSPVPKRWNSGGDFDLEIVNNQGTKFALADEYDPDKKIIYGEVEPGDYYKTLSHLIGYIGDIIAVYTIILRLSLISI